MGLDKTFELAVDFKAVQNSDGCMIELKAVFCWQPYKQRAVPAGHITCTLETFAYMLFARACDASTDAASTKMFTIVTRRLAGHCHCTDWLGQNYELYVLHNKGPFI